MRWKDKKRALRRFLHEKMKNRVKQFFHIKALENEVPEEEYSKYVSMSATTPQKCSGRWCCANRRHMEGDTLQERRQQLKMSEEIQNLNE